MSKLFPHDHDINIVQYSLPKLSCPSKSALAWSGSDSLLERSLPINPSKFPRPQHNFDNILRGTVRTLSFQSFKLCKASNNISPSHVTFRHYKEQFRPITIEKNYLAWDRQMNIPLLVYLDLLDCIDAKIFKVSGFLGFIFMALCSTFQNGCSSWGFWVI